MPDLPHPTRQLLGQVFRPDSDQSDAVRMMVFVLDSQDQAPAIRRLRDWALERAAVQPGDTVVDVESGTGTMTRELSGLVGPTPVTGVEPNPALRSVAADRVEAGQAVQFVDGLASALPFADASVDLIWCERVLQHLPDAQAAITEFARVLRPGGRAVLLDSDHGTRVTSDIDPVVEAKILAAFLGQTANPFAARRIPRLAIAAGLTVDPDIGSAALVMPPEALRQAPLLAAAAAQAVSDGTVTEDEMAEALRVHQLGIDEGYAFSAVTMFGFLVNKP